MDVPSRVGNQRRRRLAGKEQAHAFVVPQALGAKAIHAQPKRDQDRNGGPKAIQTYCTGAMRSGNGVHGAILTQSVAGGKWVEGLGSGSGVGGRGANMHTKSQKTYKEYTLKKVLLSLDTLTNL